VPTLKKLPRDKLNDKARALGIEKPEHLRNRAAVVEAIEAHKAAADAANPFGGTARVVSVFGAFNSRCLIEVSAETAAEAFGRLDEAARTNAIDSVERDLAEIRKADKALAESAMAAVAVRLAYELEDPYNSATSKSMCAKALNDTLDRLRELAPEEEKGKSTLDEIAERRQARLEGKSAAAN